MLYFSIVLEKMTDTGVEEMATALRVNKSVGYIRSVRSLSGSCIWFGSGMLGVDTSGGGLCN